MAKKKETLIQKCKRLGVENYNLSEMIDEIDSLRRLSNGLITQVKKAQECSDEAGIIGMVASAAWCAQIKKLRGNGSKVGAGDTAKGTT